MQHKVRAAEIWWWKVANSFWMVLMSQDLLARHHPSMGVMSTPFQKSGHFQPLGKVQIHPKIAVELHVVHPVLTNLPLFGPKISTPTTWTIPQSGMSMPEMRTQFTMTMHKHWCVTKLMLLLREKGLAAMTTCRCGTWPENEPHKTEEYEPAKELWMQRLFVTKFANGEDEKQKWLQNQFTNRDVQWLRTQPLRHKNQLCKQLQETRFSRLLYNSYNIIVLYISPSLHLLPLCLPVAIQ